jgi:histidinol phosphatase-like enzyme
MNSNIMKTILNSDGSQFHQYHQSMKSPLTSTHSEHSLTLLFYCPLTPPHFSAYPKPGYGILTSYVVQ